MERIVTEPRLQTILAAGQGVVFNDFSGRGASGAQYNVVHVASCRWLARSSLAVPKIWFEDLLTAAAWLERERGPEGRAWKRCATCQAGTSPVMPTRSRDRVSPSIERSIRHPDNQSYLISVGRAGTRVDAWSSTRLPFEPVGPMLEFRKALRSAVEAMSATPNKALHAIYTSPVVGSFDVENVLFYNVGTGSFARSAGSELVVERVTGSVPPPPKQLDANHHHAYSITNLAAPWQAWSFGRDVASFASADLASPADAARAAPVWLAVRRGDLIVHAVPDAALPLGLELTIALPDRRRVNLAALAKPLIDGIVAAFHVHADPAELEPIVARLGAQLSVPDAGLRKLLTDNPAAVLGARRLLRPWRDGLQWNPADDRFVALRLRVGDRAPRPSSSAVRLKGTVVEMAEASR